MLNLGSGLNDLFYATVRVIATRGADENVGTGFFFRYAINDNGDVLDVLITNRHVVEGVPPEPGR